ncbi:MAG: hypothetical protein PHZ19_05330 [Candidatus Thermoplasmatota archaeon]|nr:hypothetical protein [Candidatus Thermoplasmatota archaeon]
MADWQIKWRDVSQRPSPVVLNNKKYCPEHYAQGVLIELTGSRQFLCKEHYKEYRRERERIRLLIKRDGYEIRDQGGKEVVVAVTREKEYNTKPGTSDFGPHVQTDTQGNPDFKKEQPVVRGELNRIKNEQTIGDRACRSAEGAYKPETRERLVKNLAYTADFDGYVQFDVSGEEDAELHALATEEWHYKYDDEKSGEESGDEYCKRLKDKYKDWTY